MVIGDVTCLHLTPVATNLSQLSQAISPILYWSMHKYLVYYDNYCTISRKDKEIEFLLCGRHCSRLLLSSTLIMNFLDFAVEAAVSTINVISYQENFSYSRGRAAFHFSVVSRRGNT